MKRASSGAGRSASIPRKTWPKKSGPSSSAALSTRRRTSETAPVGAAVRRPAWAKVNLALHVLGRRGDGYHELDSLVVFAAVGDEITITPAPAGRLTLRLNGPFAAPLRRVARTDNLVLRAARLLRAHGRVAAGARIRLTKRLPVAAGLGGGSADAAATLQALRALWRLDMPDAALAALGARLGADVPVCLAGRASVVRGVGERIVPASALPPVWLVLVNPGVPLSTPRVFAAHSGAFSRPVDWPAGYRDAAALAAHLAVCSNDLEAAACDIVPEIGAVLDTLKHTQGCLLARLSGSGATCFGLYADADAAAAASARIAAARPRWWVCAAPVLGPDDGAEDTS
ncbi:MAG: 4-(cytidine 5'-diphospho)-2-C-methyl-D-erythritol kinase [Alphaproteobacteria bacterium]|nr:MAG: 4-(cytidine 5'-diphospho)-2-C-methyl-D-erythritol kinase [Alphaproteobacteria bacterium]